MEALFVRKATDLAELKILTKQSEEDNEETTEYEVIKEIEMSQAAFREFAEDFSKEQQWIEENDGGVNNENQVRCIRIINKVTNERILINSEGYSYPIYTAIEK